MASYVPVVKNGANGAIFYIGLVDQSNTKLLKSTPTLAAGDFKVSIDGGALANLTTLPTVTPTAGRQVKVTLSQAEVNGDNITIQCIDAAGAEWCDLILNIQTSARQIDDLAFPTVSGRSLDVSATGEAGLDWANIGAPTTANALTGTTIATTQKVDVDTIKTNPVVNGGTITFPTTATLASTTNITAATGITVATNSDKTGYTVTGLTASNLDVAVSTLATAANLATVATYVDTEVAAIKAKTDNLPAAFPTNFAAMVITAGGIVDADVEAVTGDTGAAAKLKRVLLANTTGTVGAGSTTTSIVTSALNPAASVTDQFKGLIVKFDDATTTVALRGQGTDITASTAGGILTCTALTTAPSSGDTFTVS